MVLVTRRGRPFLMVVALCMAGAATILAQAGAAAAPNPPGNNGTIKIDDTPFDDHPNNEPHVGCVFQVDFYGYDEGDLDATVTFEAHPPTQREGDDQVLLTDTVFIGEDDNSGGGSQAGLDASATYTLDFTGIQPHPNQGFHVKLTVHADGSHSADTKHKVFWVTDCASGTTTTTTTSRGGGSKATTTSGTTTTTDASRQGTTTTTSAGGDSASSSPGGSAGGGGSSGTGGGGLPLTGANAVSLLAAGLVLVGLGTATLLARSRQRRT
jgi:LPXTG-motif cell wall-anchored protein